MLNMSCLCWCCRRRCRSDWGCSWHRRPSTTSCRSRSSWSGDCWRWVCARADCWIDSMYSRNCYHHQRQDSWQMQQRRTTTTSWRRRHLTLMRERTTCWTTTCCCCSMARPCCSCDCWHSRPRRSTMWPTCSSVPIEQRRMPSSTSYPSPFSSSYFSPYLYLFLDAAAAAAPAVVVCVNYLIQLCVCVCVCALDYVKCFTLDFFTTFGRVSKCRIRASTRSESAPFLNNNNNGKKQTNI